ncbi:hypothetical protein [Streptomyces sp. NPDC088115]|uniref:hypothetical protein n=1 Tax=Streptomyces sp. NPDC088115 TaxID=3365824 RepID=UPI0038071015
MTIVSERLVEPLVSTRLRAGLDEEIERQEREDTAKGPEAEPFAAAVRPADPGREQATEVTEHEAAAVLVESLIPWCGPCWLRAELRRQELRLVSGGGR